MKIRARFGVQGTRDVSMRIKKILFLVMILSSCQDNSTQTSTDTNGSSSTLNENVSTTSGCPSGFECQDQCANLFNVRTEQETCLNLSINEISRLYTTLTQRLRTPISSVELQKITNEDFENIVNVGARVWSRNAQDYTQQDSQRILNWLVGERSYTDKISGHSNSFLKGLFPELIESIGTPLIQSLDFLATTNENILLRAERIRNQSALRLIHSHLIEECSSSRYNRMGSRDFQRSACILGEIYCANGGRKFQEVYPQILNIDVNLHSFVIQQNGLNLSENFRDFENVCRVLCSRVNCSV